MQLRMQLLTHLRMQLLTHLRMQLRTCSVHATRTCCDATRTCSVDATATCSVDATRTCSVDATAHCMQAEDCVGWTEDCQASEVREDCKDARSWSRCTEILFPVSTRQQQPASPFLSKACRHYYRKWKRLQPCFCIFPNVSELLS